MSALVWDEIGDRYFETGVSKCVLYLEDMSGVAWNGVTSIDSQLETELSPVHFDGRKINDIIAVGDFKGVLRAYTYPEEFLQFEGTLEDSPGMYITGQIPRRFGLSYETLIGNDISGVDAGYKLHVLYNLIAIPTVRSYASLSLDPEPMEFEWDLTGLPDDIDLFRPTVHIIFDSRYVEENLMNDIRAILQGDEETDASLPSLKSLASFVQRWERLIIIDNGDGTWTAESNVEGVIVMTDPETFEITSDSIVILDPDTYEISSTDREEPEP